MLPVGAAARMYCAVLTIFDFLQIHVFQVSTQCVGRGGPADYSRLLEALLRVYRRSYLGGGFRRQRQNENLQRRTAQTAEGRSKRKDELQHTNLNKQASLFHKCK